MTTFNLKEKIKNITIDTMITVISSSFVLLSFLFTFVKNQFEKGYSESLYINNITLSIPISSVLFQISIPIIIGIFFITIFVKQSKDNIPTSLAVFFMKFLCCFQILFVISIIYAWLLILKNDLLSTLSYLYPLIISTIVSIILFFFIYKKENTNKFNKVKYFVLSILVEVVHIICFFCTLNDLSLSILIAYLTVLMSLIPVAQMFLRKDTTFNNNVNDNSSQFNKFIEKIDSPIWMLIVTVIIFYMLFAITFSFDLRSIGTNILNEQDFFTKIESNINYESNSNADGYLLFETTDKKYVAIGYKKDAKDITKIHILKGYKFIDINNIEVTEQEFRIANIND